jgi:hypothetical protein
MTLSGKKPAMPPSPHGLHILVGVTTFSAGRIKSVRLGLFRSLNIAHPSSIDDGRDSYINLSWPTPYFQPSLCL